METILAFFIGSVVIVFLWFIYLILNNLLDALNPGFIQEVLGGALSFGLFMAVGVVLYYASQPLLLGWFVVLTIIALYSGAKKLFRLKDNGSGDTAAG